MSTMFEQKCRESFKQAVRIEYENVDVGGGRRVVVSVRLALACGCSAALPHELSDEQRISLTHEFAQRIADRYLVAVDASIHGAAATGNSRNFHAHLLTTTRVVEREGLGKKSTMELSSGDRMRAGLGSAIGELLFLRELWAAAANAQLEQAGSDARIDHRRLAAQGIERVPQRRRGVALTALLRRNQETAVGQRLHDEEFAEDKPAAAVSVARDS